VTSQAASRIASQMKQSISRAGMYKSTDAGTTWTMISRLATGTGQYSISDPAWFGSYAWDPVHNDLYATAISNPAMQKQLGGTAISLNYSKIAPHNEITIDHATIHSACPFNYVALFSLSGKMLFCQHVALTGSLRLPNLSGKNVVVEIANADGSSSAKSISAVK
jgi:hypothetical protein